MNRVAGCGGRRDIDVLHAARLRFDPGDLARVAHRDVQVAAFPRQAVGAIGNARPRVDQDRAHVGSIEIQHLDFIRHAARRDVRSLLVGSDCEPMEVDTDGSVAGVLGERVGPGVEAIEVTAAPVPVRSDDEGIPAARGARGLLILAANDVDEPKHPVVQQVPAIRANNQVATGLEEPVRHQLAV